MEGTYIIFFIHCNQINFKRTPYFIIAIFTFLPLCNRYDFKLYNNKYFERIIYITI